MPYAMGGGASGITINTTTITGGADGQVLYNNAGTVGGNANLFFDDTANAEFLRVGAGTAPGAIRLLEGSASGTNYSALTVPTTLGGNRTVTFPDATLTVAGLEVANVFTTTQTFPNGAVGTPSIIGGTAGAGLFFDGSDVVFAAGGLAYAAADASTGFQVRSDFYFSFSSTTTANGATDTRISRVSAGNVQIAQSGTAGAANSIQIGEAGIIFEGSTDNTFETTLAVVDPTSDTTWQVSAQGAGTYTFAGLEATQIWSGAQTFNGVTTLGTQVNLDRTITAGGTTGAQTINKIAGTVNFAATATTLVVTNSLVNTSSIVYAVVRTADATAEIKSVVPAAGSFTITLSAAATAETSVGFFVTN